MMFSGNSPASATAVESSDAAESTLLAARLSPLPILLKTEGFLGLSAAEEDDDGDDEEEDALEDVAEEIVGAAPTESVTGLGAGIGGAAAEGGGAENDAPLICRAIAIG